MFSRQLSIVVKAKTTTTTTQSKCATTKPSPARSSPPARVFLTRRLRAMCRLLLALFRAEVVSLPGSSAQSSNPRLRPRGRARRESASRRMSLSAATRWAGVLSRRGRRGGRVRPALPARRRGGEGTGCWHARRSDSAITTAGFRKLTHGILASLTWAVGGHSHGGGTMGGMLVADTIARGSPGPRDVRSCSNY